MLMFITCTFYNVQCTLYPSRACFSDRVSLVIRSPLNYSAKQLKMKLDFIKEHSKIYLSVESGRGSSDPSGKKYCCLVREQQVPAVSGRGIIRFHHAITHFFELVGAKAPPRFFLGGPFENYGGPKFTEANFHFPQPYFSQFCIKIRLKSYFIH